MTQEVFWNVDRILAAVAIVLGVAAIVLGVGGIWRAEHLFKKLNDRAETMTEDFLRNAITIVASYSSFSRALQGVELLPDALPKDGAFALLTVYHLQSVLHSGKLSAE